MAKDEKAPRQAPQIPSDMKAFNQKLIEEFRKNGGKLSGPMAGRTLMLLTTTGAKSRQPRTTVLGFAKEGNRYLVIASANGAPKHPAWYTNLQADPEATVEVGPDRIPVRASTASPDEHDKLAALIPWAKGEQQKTSRRIPIVVLSPTR